MPRRAGFPRLDVLQGCQGERRMLSPSTYRNPAHRRRSALRASHQPLTVQPGLSLRDGRAVHTLLRPREEDYEGWREYACPGAPEEEGRECAAPDLLPQTRIRLCRLRRPFRDTSEPNAAPGVHSGCRL